jgi:two-component system, probable response regulator PhcQ
MTTPSVKRSVLIADDDPEVLGALARGVRALGYEVHTAEDGAEALRTLRSQRIDLLLSDIDMPELDGVALAAIARAEQLASIRILLTAHARLDSALSAINGGEVHRYLTKPWKQEELGKTLADAFSRIDDLRRMHAADHAARRLRAACDALEQEFPGLTHVERDVDVYTVNERRAQHAVDQLEGTTFAALLGVTRSK